MNTTAEPGSETLPRAMTLRAIRERDSVYNANDMRWSGTLQPIKDRRELLALLDTLTQKRDEMRAVLSGTRTLMRDWLKGPEAGLHGEITKSLPYIERALAPLPTLPAVNKASEVTP